jgi:hypothetical protein
LLEDLLWGIWNGITAWPLLILHVFHIWEQYPVYNVARDDKLYQLGFLLGAGSPFFGLLAGGRRRLKR